MKGGVSFQNFQKKERIDFSLKNGGIGNIGGCFKREDITYFHTN